MQNRITNPKLKQKHEMEKKSLLYMNQALFRH